MTKPTVAKKAPATKHDKPSAGSEGIKLTSGLQNILNHAAKLTLEGDDGPEISREDLALELNLNVRSLANNFPKLKNARLIIVSAKTIRVTELGMKHANTEGLVSKAPENNDEHQDRLMEKYKLSGGEKKVLAELRDGASYTKQEVADKLGLKIRSFTNLLTKPKKNGLLEVTTKTIRLSDKMFIKKLGRPCDKK